MGMPQFMFSSYKAYVADFDEDGIVDIWNNPTNAIGSIANYLNVYGCRPDEKLPV